MGSLSTCLSQSLPEIRNPNGRFIHFNGVTLTSTICSIETRSLQHSHRHNIISLEAGSLLCISPTLSDSLCTKQNTTRPSTNRNIDNILLADTVVVSTSCGNVNKETNCNTKFNHSFSRSKSESSSISSKTVILVAWQVSGTLQGLSEETKQLIAKSRR